MIEVQPYYGWGWSDGNEATVELPEPFAVEVGSGSASLSGIVKSGSYVGWKIEISPRHVEWDGVVNMTLTDPTDEVYSVHGFGSIPIESMKL